MQYARSRNLSTDTLLGFSRFLSMMCRLVVSVSHTGDASPLRTSSSASSSLLAASRFLLPDLVCFCLVSDLMCLSSAVDALSVCWTESVLILYQADISYDYT